MTKKISYLFTIDPYVFTRIQGMRVFLYNTLNQKTVSIDNNKYFLNIFMKINSLKNCGVVKLSKKE